jgi:SAM-dependent methyltransferase
MGGVSPSRDPLEVRRQLQSVLDDLLTDTRIRALEAGCGSLSHVNLGHESHIVGIDISQEQLDKNTSVDEKILGDIETYPLPDSEFHVIVCWEVFEHLPRPKRALANMVRALKPGGLLVLAFPNVRSLKGLVTRYTPHRFHVWYYRYVLGHKLAGTEGRGPYPTFMRPSIAPDRIRRLAASHGLTVAFLAMVEGQQQRTLRARVRVVGPVWSFLKFTLHVLSLGTITAELTDCVMVLKKQPVTTDGP